MLLLMNFSGYYYLIDQHAFQQQDVLLFLVVISRMISSTVDLSEMSPLKNLYLSEVFEVEEFKSELIEDKSPE